MIQDLSGSWCIKGTGESTLVMDSPVPLMHHDPDRPWITDPNSDHPKGTHPKTLNFPPSISTVACSSSENSWKMPVLDLWRPHILNSFMRLCNEGVTVCGGKWQWQKSAWNDVTTRKASYWVSNECREECRAGSNMLHPP